MTQDPTATLSTATWLAVLAAVGAGVWLGLRIGIWLVWPWP